MTYVIITFFSESTLYWDTSVLLEGTEMRRLNKEKRVRPGCFAVGNELVVDWEDRRAHVIKFKMFW